MRISGGFVSWTWLPSLLGILLLVMGFLVIPDGAVTMGVVLVVLSLPCLALWGWMVKREGQRR